MGSKALRYALAALCAALATLARGEDAYPVRPVHLVIGFPAGTAADVTARIIAPPLGAALGQQVVVENRPGAGSSIAAEAVARAPGDGYILLLSTTANTINPSLYRLSFDFARDLPAVALLGDVPTLLVAHPGAPATVQQLIAQGRAKPGTLQFASSGIGTLSHLYGELFNQATGTRLVHVPYKGSSQVMTDLLAGRVSLSIAPASTVVPYVTAGRLRALAVIGRSRVHALPQVPTMAEAGVSGFDSGLWLGLNASLATSREIRERLHDEVTRVLAMPDVRAQLAAQSIEPAPATTLSSFQTFIANDVAKWAHVVRVANIHPE